MTADGPTSRKPKRHAAFALIFRDPTSEKLDKDDAFFARIPDQVSFDDLLTDREYRVLDRLCRIRRSYGKNGIPFNMKSFAKECGRGYRQTREIIAILEEKGFIGREKNGNEVRLYFRSFTNVYQGAVGRTPRLSETGDLTFTDKWRKSAASKRRKSAASEGRKSAGAKKQRRRKSSGGEGGNPPSPSSPPSEVEPTAKPTAKRVTAEWNTDCVAGARRLEEEMKRYSEHSLRSCSERESLRSSPSSDSLRSSSVSHTPSKDVPPSAGEAEVDTPQPPSPRERTLTRKLPSRIDRIAFSKGEPAEGEQIALFGPEKKKPKNSPPKKAPTRHKKAAGKKTARKTPKGGTTPMQAIGIFNERLAKSFPNAPISLTPRPSDIGQLSKKVSGYSPLVVARMVGVLFDDWNVFKGTVWPKPSEKYPVVAHLWRHATTLVTAIDTGLTDGSSRVSKHSLREKGAAGTYEVPDIGALYEKMYGSNNS